MNKRQKAWDDDKPIPQLRDAIFDQFKLKKTWHRTALEQEAYAVLSECFISASVFFRRTRVAIFKA